MQTYCSAMKGVIMTIITDSNFEEKVLKNTKPVMIDFYADWCGPCKMISPIVEEIADEMKDKIDIFKVNIDNSPELARKYSVMSIPSLVFIKDGEYVSKLVGARPKAEIIEAIDKVICLNLLSLVNLNLKIELLCRL